MSIFDSLEKDKSISKQMMIACMILEEYNCRAAEVLSANWKLFFPGKYLILKGKKKSQDVIVTDRKILSLINSLPDHKSEEIFWTLDYSKLYQEIKKKYSHLFAKFKTKSNFKVTHGFRYLNASYTDDPDSVKSILHHNSLKSGKSYNKNLANSK